MFAISGYPMINRRNVVRGFTSTLISSPCWPTRSPVPMASAADSEFMEPKTPECAERLCVIIQELVQDEFLNIELFTTLAETQGLVSRPAISRK